MKYENNKIYDCYLVDEDGYYDGQSAAQCVDGALMMPENAVMEKPELKKGYFYRYEKSAKKWIAEKMPGGIADLADVKISASSQSARAQVLREMARNYAQALGPKDPWEIAREDDYIIVRKKNITVRDLKDQRLDELRALKNAFESGERNKNIYVISSLGFKADADQKSLDYINAILDTAQGRAKIRFKDANNDFHDLTGDQVAKLKYEIQKNKISLLNQYWLYKELIESAKAKKDLENIKFDFAMSDFSGGS